MPNDIAHPRPEYPRPDRQRGSLDGVDWLNLNGPWQFRFDPDKNGVEKNWHQPGEPEWREQILVPFCWESLAAWGQGDSAGNENYYSTRVFLNPLEVTRANHRSAPRYEVGWYRREVQIPNRPEWENKRIILTIGAADFFTDAWCNGKHLGHHEGGYTPFEFDLTDALETGPDGTRTATLVLRVEDPMDNREQPVGKQWRWYTPTSGIWQTVFLEPRHASHIEKFRFISDVEAGTMRFIVNSENAEADSVVVVEVFPPSTHDSLVPSGPPQRFTIPIKQGLAEQTIKVEPLRLWGPNQPWLYSTILSLQSGGETRDVVRTYFGMRKLDFATLPGADAPVALRLNGRPRYLRGALYQSFYPDGVYTAGDAEVLRKDIKWAKRFGFNFLRIHIKIDDPLLLYYADKLGILLMADFPNFGEGGDTPLGRRRFEAMMREAIDRDFNHPSIFAWCMFNETWGFGGQSEFADEIVSHDPSKITVQDAEKIASKIPKAKLANLHSFPWVQRMWELAKELDPTRLIEDMSVCHWEHLEYYLHGDTDINSWHFYIKDYAKAKVHIEKVVKSTFKGSSFNYVPGYHHKGQPLINSEFGGIGAMDGDVDVSWSFKFLTNELRRHQQIAAYIYTELTDVEWEYNGFLNYDRTPKHFSYDPAGFNSGNALPMDAPPIQRVPPGEVVRIPVSSSHYSRQRHQNVSLQWRLSGIDQVGRFHQNVVHGIVPIEFPHLRVAPAHNIEVRMPEVPMLAVLTVEAFTAQGELVAQNFIHFYVSNGPLPLREELPGKLILRGAADNYSQAQWSGGKSDYNTEQRAMCHGDGYGFFEWTFSVKPEQLATTSCIRVLAEASSHRLGAPQTDEQAWPTKLQVSVNGIPIQRLTLPNHPHDAAGVLSYLNGFKGAYGNLLHAISEGEILRRIIGEARDGVLQLRFAVPQNAIPQGGLTLYGTETGRYPVCPTLIVEW